MKNLITVSVAIVFMINSVKAQIATPTVNIATNEKADKLFLKAKHQKNAAWGLLGGGTATVLIGLAIFPKDYNLFAGFFSPPNSRSTEAKANFSGVVCAVGGLSMLGSIPLFIASGKNKKRARLVMDSEKVQIPGAQAKGRQAKIGIVVPL